MSSSTPDWGAVKDKRMCDLTPAQQEDARELWLREQLGWMGEYHLPHYKFLLKRLDEARAALTDQPAAHRPVAHFLNNAADGEPPHYAQVAAEYIGTKGVFPLYAHPAAAPRDEWSSVRSEIRAAHGAAPQGVQAEPPPGFVLVPRELTEEMHAAAVRTIVRCHGNDDFPPRVYRAMLAAAPAAPAQEPQQPARATRMPPASSTASDEWEA